MKQCGAVKTWGEHGEGGKAPRRDDNRLIARMFRRFSTARLGSVRCRSQLVNGRVEVLSSVLDQHLVMTNIVLGHACCREAFFETGANTAAIRRAIAAIASASSSTMNEVSPCPTAAKAIAAGLRSQRALRSASNVWRLCRARPELVLEVLELPGAPAARLEKANKTGLSWWAL